MVKQEDGNGFDIGGIEQATMAAYSKRSADVDAEKRELIAQYEQDHGGRAPDRAALYKLRKKATVRDPRSERAPAGADGRAGSRSRSAGARRVDAHGRERECPAPGDAAGGGGPLRRRAGPSRMPSETERARAIRIGVAEVQRQNSTWTRGKLIWELHRALGAACWLTSTRCPTSRRWRTMPSAALLAPQAAAATRTQQGGGTDSGHGDHPDSAGAGRGRRRPARPAQRRHQHLPQARRSPVCDQAPSRQRRSG